MASLYEIDGMVLTVLEDGLIFDEETGEVLFDADNLDALELERNAKLEAVACFVKSLEADAAAIKAEERALAERRQAKERKAERLRAYISDSMTMLGDTKLETARVAISFRKSEAVEIVDASQLPEAYWKQAAPTPDKTAIKKALKAGEAVAGAAIVERRNLQLK